MGASPPLQHWQEWYRRCAADRCAEPVRVSLAAFAHSRFLTYLQRLGGGRIDRGAVESPACAWHLFESHLQLKSTRQGKRYKDWLFARLDGTSDAPARVLEAGASLIVRSVVREHVRHERPAAGTVSLDAPLSDDLGAAITLEALLPAPGDTVVDVIRREGEALARTTACAAFSGLARRTRVALAAKALGVSLAHPVVERAAGARKSALSDDYRRWLLALAEDVRVRSRGDGDLTRLALEALKHAQDLAVEWARSEKGCARLFWIADGG
jgi:hypothetical protein